MQGIAGFSIDCFVYTVYKPDFHMKLFWGVSFDTPHTLQTSPPPPPKRGDLKKIGQIKPKSKRQKILS